MGELTSQLPAAEPVVEPSGTFLSACATLNWIAFRRAEDGDMTGRSSFRQKFGYEPVRPPGPSALEFAVAEAAGKLTPDHHAFLQRHVSCFGAEPRELQPARRVLAEMAEYREWGAVAFHIYFEARRNRWVELSDQIAEAQRQLVDALAAERLTAIATKAAAPPPDLWRHPLHAIGPAMVVPWTFFLTLGVSVELSGAITAPSDSGFLHAQFRTSEVLGLWPSPGCLPLPPGDNPISNHAAATAAEWMQSHVTEPGRWKRESALAQCRADTKATYREALAAWKALPGELRGPRGARK